MGNPWEVFFTIGWLALWLLFPIGVFLSVGRIDKNTDQLIRFKKLRQVSMPERGQLSRPKKSPFHLPQWASYRKPLRH